MDEAAVIQYICSTFADVEVATAFGGTFFMFDPDGRLPPERRLPFATLVATDENDSFSNLNRPGIFRLNIGVSKETFRSMFSSEATDTSAGSESDYDYTAVDRFMPHPVYGKMYWLCILNPSAATFETVRKLLAEAYEMAVGRHSKARSATES